MKNVILHRNIISGIFLIFFLMQQFLLHIIMQLYLSFFFSSSSSLPSFYLFSFSLSFSHSSSTLFPPFSFFFFFFFSSFSPYILLLPLFPPPPYSYGFYLNVIISMKITFCQKYILLSLFNFCCSVTQSCPTLCDTMDCCTIAFTVL